MLDDLLEVIVELLLEFVVDGGVDAITSKKKLSRGKVTLAILAAIICFVIIIVVVVFGFMTLDESIMGGVFIIVVGAGLFVAAVKKFVIELVIKLIKKSQEMKQD